MAKVQLHILYEDTGRSHNLSCEIGANLQRVLLDHGCAPYTSLTRRLNCGGNGLCATCGVFIVQDPKPTHWHDRLARTFRYPRLSCQIEVNQDLTIVIPKKIIWGKRKPR